MKNPLPVLSCGVFSLITRSRVLCLSGLLAISILAGGCSSLPDVSPFRSASSQLRLAVAESGAAVESELRLLPEGNEQADTLRDNWKERDNAFTAIVAYSDSISALVDSGNNGAKSAERVADSVKALGEAAGVAIPASDQAVALATDIGKFLYEQIAKARAAKNLEKAMAAAQPGVDRIAEKISADLKDLEEIYIVANTLDDNRIRTEFNQFTSYRNSVLKQMTGGDPGDTNKLASQAQLAQILRDMDATHAEYTSQRKKVADRLRAGQGVIIAARQGAAEWAAAHASVVSALNHRRPVDISSLQQAAVQMNDLIKRMREI